MVIDLKDIQNIFYQCCIKLLPNVCNFLLSINNSKYNINNILSTMYISDSLVSLIYIEYNKNINIEQYNDEDHNKINELKYRFYDVIKILSLIDDRTIIFINKDVDGTNFIDIFRVDTCRYLYPHKMTFDDFLKELPNGLKIVDDERKINYIKNTPVVEDLCQFCYTNKPTLISSCNFHSIYDDNEIFTHQYCNVCITQLILKDIDCPICNCKFSVDELSFIVTKPEDDGHLIQEFTENI
jgi:hypothetical protein